MFDFLVEFVLELVGGLVMEDGVGAACDCRRPRWVRVLILTGMSLFFAAVPGTLLVVGVMAFRETPVVSALLLAMAAGFAALGLFKLRRILNNFTMTKTE